MLKLVPPRADTKLQRGVRHLGSVELRGLYGIPHSHVFFVMIGV